MPRGFTRAVFAATFLAFSCRSEIQLRFVDLSQNDRKFVTPTEAKMLNSAYYKIRWISSSLMGHLARMQTCCMLFYPTEVRVIWKPFLKSIMHILRSAAPLVFVALIRVKARN